MTKVFFPEDSKDLTLGGKFSGLKELKEAGLPVPPFFGLKVEGEHAPVELEKALAKLPQGALAVRSSAALEDGALLSFAGQFETVLHVAPNALEVWKAACHCLDSTQFDRAKAYAAESADSLSRGFSVVVQHMIQPIWAGVLFTMDPVSNFHDRMVLSAVPGEGENLVSGRANSLDFILPKWGRSKGKDANTKNNPEWSESWTNALFEGGRLMEQRLGKPLDLEWAVDEVGKIWWLQCRPVTTASPQHPNELDARLRPETEEQDWFTLGNIGEMMPGAVSPLTAEVFGGAIESGLQDFARKSGALPKQVSEPRYVQAFYGRLFFNLSALYDFSRHTALNHKENIDRSIVGRTISNGPVLKETKGFQRILHFFGQMAYIQSAGRRLAKLEHKASNWHPIWAKDASQLLPQLQQARELLEEAFRHHFATSSQSGSYYSALLQVLEKKHRDAAKAAALANQLLTNIGGLESADPLSRLMEIAEEIRRRKPFDQAFAKANLSEARLMLEKFGPEPLVLLYQNFMKRHGHRGIREAEFLEPSWADAPESLLGMLQHLVKSGSSGPSSSPMRPKSKFNLGLNLLASLARKAVLRREKSKSSAIRILHLVRKGYQQLGALAVEQKLLSVAEDVFFLQSAEHNALFAGQLPQAKAIVEGRRRAFKQASFLQFEDVFQGKPFPTLPKLPTQNQLGAWFGVPVSPGKTSGKVHLVHSLEDAAALQPGEIMVCGFTDIGWTPYFGVAGALVTEIGSPLSHGAVVAREFGLPAVVGVSGIMAGLKNGDTLVVNANTGEISLVK